MSKFVSYRANFRGTLAGITVEELKGLDYEKEKLIDRMKEVLDKLDKVQPILDEYFFQKEDEEKKKKKKEVREYYKCSPNTTDELSEDINICKIIKSYGSYILNSKDLYREK